MDTKQQWQDAVEEFGDRSFERFFVNHGDDSFDPSSNEEAIEYLNQLNQIPLPYLFENDISFYGNKAFLMWEWQYKDNGIDKWVDQWGTCDEPLSFEDNLNYRRKMSAELPFDLERAKAGDNVECRVLKPKRWVDCIFINTETKIYGHHFIKHDAINPHNGKKKMPNIGWWKESNLRMKYLTKLENKK